MTATAAGRWKPVAGLLASAALAAATLAQAAPPHQHGVAHLDIALDGAWLTVDFNSPLDNLVGFERPPRNERERGLVREAARKLREGALVEPPAAAACKLESVQFDAPWLDPALLAAPGASAPAAKRPPGTTPDHTELGALMQFRCAEPGALTELQVRLAEAFRGIQKIEVRIVGPAGQQRRSMGRGARTLRL
ncbi:MAG: DUF2796 domain-containing protein [Aquabacterium sp.]